MACLRGITRLVMLMTLVAAVDGCSSTSPTSAMNRASQTPTPPVAAVEARPVISPHGTRLDPYYWLRDDLRLDPKVLGYLNAENEYADAMMAPLKPLQSALYEEIVSRIPKDDVSVPFREHGYWYYTRVEAGREYPIFARRRDAVDLAQTIGVGGRKRRARARQFHRAGPRENDFGLPVGRAPRHVVRDAARQPGKENDEHDAQRDADDADDRAEGPDS